MADIKVYPDAAAAAGGLGSYTAEIASKAITERGAFTLAIAGGSLVKVREPLLLMPPGKRYHGGMPSHSVDRACRCWPR